MAGKPWTDAEIRRARELLRAVDAPTYAERCRCIAATLERTPESVRTKLREYRADVNMPELTIIEQDILGALHQRRYSIGELTRLVDRSDITVQAAIAHLAERGYAVEYHNDTHQVNLNREGAARLDPLDMSALRGDVIRFGLLSDTHYGSRYQCASLVDAAYSQFERDHVSFVLHCGDLTDGIKMYRGHEQELWLHSADEQRDYVAERYPYIEGVKTYIISGNHDLAFRKIAGYTIVQEVSRMRDDIVYRGDIRADYILPNGCKLIMIHPRGSGAYAKSYHAQKAAAAAVDEALAAEAEIPAFIAIGHYHFWGMFAAGRTDVTMIPCLQQQTPYMVERYLSPDIGFVMVEIQFDVDGEPYHVIPYRYRMGRRVRKEDF